MLQQVSSSVIQVQSAITCELSYTQDWAPWFRTRIFLYTTVAASSYKSQSFFSSKVIFQRLLIYEVRFSETQAQSAKLSMCMRAIWKRQARLNGHALMLYDRADCQEHYCNLTIHYVLHYVYKQNISGWTFCYRDSWFKTCVYVVILRLEIQCIQNRQKNEPILFSLIKK